LAKWCCFGVWVNLFWLVAPWPWAMVVVRRGPDAGWRFVLFLRGDLQRSLLQVRGADVLVLAPEVGGWTDGELKMAGRLR